MNFLRAVITLFIFVVLAGIHLYVFTQNVNLNYSVTDLKIKLGELRSRNRYLGSKVAEKEDLSVIEKVAREKLGMFYPEEINYILVTPEASGKN